MRVQVAVAFKERARLASITRELAGTRFAEIGETTLRRFDFAKEHGGPRDLIAAGTECGEVADSLAGTARALARASVLMSPFRGGAA